MTIYRNERRQGQPPTRKNGNARLQRLRSSRRGADVQLLNRRRRQVHKMLQSESNTRHVTLKTSSLESSLSASINNSHTSSSRTRCKFDCANSELTTKRIMWYGPDTSLGSSSAELRGRSLSRFIDQDNRRSRPASRR